MSHKHPKVSYCDHVIGSLALTNQDLGDCMNVTGEQFSTVCYGKKKRSMLNVSIVECVEEMSKCNHLM